MGLFNFGRKKCCCCGDTKTHTSCCEGNITAKEEVCCSEAVDGICCIKVLGAGCKSCHEQYEYVQKAVANMKIDIKVEYITDMEKIMTYGVMSMPAIVVNEKVAAMGKVLKVADVEQLLRKYTT